MDRYIHVASHLGRQCPLWDAILNPLYTGENPQNGTFTNSEDPDEMPHI